MNPNPVTASEILDMAFDAGLERPKIATAGEWDGGRIHILTHGAPAFRKTLEIKSPAKREQVLAILQEALGSKPEPPPAVVAHVPMPMVAEKPKAKRRANAGP